MGLYGTIEPGTALEFFAIVALRDLQSERILQNLLLAQSSTDAKPDTLQKAFKEYAKAADPFTEEELKKADERKMKMLGDEVRKGAFGIVPLVDHSGDQVLLRDKPRIRKPYAMRKKR